LSLINNGFNSPEFHVFGVTNNSNVLKEEYKSYVSNIPSVSGNDFPALLNYCVTILNILCCIRRL